MRKLTLDTSIKWHIHWPKYCIRENNNGEYYAQKRVWFFFWDDFTEGNFLDGHTRKLFPTIKSAQDYINAYKKYLLKRNIKNDPIVYQE